MSISQVLRHLYISDCVAAQSESVLAERSIRRIISITERAENFPPSELCRSLGVRTKTFPIIDESFIDEEEVLVKDFFPWLHEAIENRETVLVHCEMGLSRSPSFVVAYLVWEGMDPGEALRLVQKKHPDTSPWLDTMESFLGCVGANVPEEHKDKSGERERVK